MNSTTINNNNDKIIKKTKMQGFILGALVGGVVVAGIKNDSKSIEKIASTVAKVATSYYGCKLIYNLFS